jgi:hypothetical protein
MAAIKSQEFREGECLIMSFSDGIKRILDRILAQG